MHTRLATARRMIWPLLGIALAAVVAFAGQTGPLSQLVAAAGVAISVGLACWAHGWKGCALMVAACLLITFSMENPGVATGFPFGSYHFEVDPSWPRIGAIPLIVGPLYFGVGYLAWTIAGVLLDDADLRLDRAFNVVARPIVSAFVMVQWDLVMDPPSSTLNHAWIWRHGRRVFRRAALELRRLVSHHVALLPGFRAYDPSLAGDIHSPEVPLQARGRSRGRAALPRHRPELRCSLLECSGFRRRRPSRRDLASQGRERSIRRHHVVLHGADRRCRAPAACERMGIKERAIGATVGLSLAPLHAVLTKSRRVPAPFSRSSPRRRHCHYRVRAFPRAIRRL